MNNTTGYEWILDDLSQVERLSNANADQARELMMRVITGMNSLAATIESNGLKLENLRSRSEKQCGHLEVCKHLLEVEQQRARVFEIQEASNSKPSVAEARPAVQRIIEETARSANELNALKDERQRNELSCLLNFQSTCMSCHTREWRQTTLEQLRAVSNPADYICLQIWDLEIQEWISTNVVEATAAKDLDDSSKIPDLLFFDHLVSERDSVICLQFSTRVDCIAVRFQITCHKNGHAECTADFPLSILENNIDVGSTMRETHVVDWMQEVVECVVRELK